MKFPQHRDFVLSCASMETNRVKIAHMLPGWRIRVIVDPSIGPVGAGAPAFTVEGTISEINERFFRLGVDPLPEEIETWQQSLVDPSLDPVPEPTGHSWRVPFGVFVPDGGVGVEVLSVEDGFIPEQVGPLRQTVVEFKPAITVRLPMKTDHLARFLMLADEIWPANIADRNDDGDIDIYPIG